MSIKRTTAYVTSAAAMLAIGVLAQSGSASGALTTRCDGEAQGVTVPGDLVVPAGKSFLLSGVTVEGAVRVQQGSDLLLLDGSTVAGEVRLAVNSYAEIVGSTVNGSLIGRGMYGATIDQGTVVGDVQMRPNAEYTGISFLDSLASTIGGSVDTRTGDVFIESTAVGNAVTSIGAELTDIVDSTVNGDLVVRNNAFGATVCASEIYGDAQYRQNAYGLQLGGSGPLGPCDGATFWGGDVVIQANTGDAVGIDFSNGIVAGALSGEQNSPAPTGAGNRIRGGASGQFSDLQPSMTPMIAARSAAADAGATRDDRVEQQAAERRAAAEAKAAQAGQADLVP